MSRPAARRCAVAVAALLASASALAISPMYKDARYDYYFIPHDIERHESPRNDAALPLSKPIEGQENYTTQQAAANAAAHAVIALSTEYESGGAIYQDETGFHFTAPVTATKTTEIDFRVGLPHGAKLIAVFHSHVGNAGNADEFSPSDVTLQRTLGAAMYVVVVSKKEVIGCGGVAGFPLDAVPLVYPTIEIAGVIYRIRADRGVYLLLEHDGRQFLWHKPS
jgi:hypothetical protein